MMSNTFRFSGLVSVVFVVAGAAGCASTAPVQSGVASTATDAQPYCYQAVTSRLKTCTKSSVPSLATDAQAKRFEPDAKALTVYVVRRNWADGPVSVKVQADSGPSAETLPSSMVRFRLSPGAHTIAFEHEGQRQTRQIEGKAGDIRFVRLEGDAVAWSPSFSWVTELEAATRERARKARLVADL